MEGAKIFWSKDKAAEEELRSPWRLNKAKSRRVYTNGGRKK
jgi:hypothetical protein